MNPTYTFVAENEAATTQFGNMLAEQFCGGEVVGLIGTLGSGKTRLVQAIATPFGDRISSLLDIDLKLCGTSHSLLIAGIDCHYLWVRPIQCSNTEPGIGQP